MALESLTVLASGFGFESPQSGVPSLKSVLTELQGIKISVASGQCNGGVAMTVSGIATTDTIIAAWELPTASPTSTTLLDRTASTKISAANAVTCNEGLDKASLFLVIWFNKE